MKYAIIKLGGKQLKVKENDVFEIERQASLDNDVLAFAEDDKIEIGTPVLKNFKVELVQESEKLGDKVTVLRFRAKSRHKRKVGHRQPLSVVKVKSIKETK